MNSSSSSLIAVISLHNANNSASGNAPKFPSPVKRWQLCQLLFSAPLPLIPVFPVLHRKLHHT